MLMDPALAPVSVKHRELLESYIQRRRDEDARNSRARDLISAIDMGAYQQNIPISNPTTIHEFIKERIEQHQRMIKTLEWFGAHIGLDDPGDGVFVREVILEGLQAIRNRMTPR